MIRKLWRHLFPPQFRPARWLWDLQLFAAPSFPRTADVLATGSVVLTVPWALASGQAGYGVSGVTQNGTATFTITVSSGNIAAIAPQLFALLDSADALARGGNAIAVVT